MSMNIFRLVGDLCHQTAIALLILQLYRSKNARGISIKTQELRLLVFCTRYLDLFTTFYSLYNSIAKIAYITATIVILVMCKTDPIKSVYNAQQDSFPHWKFAVLPCAVLALVFHCAGVGGSYYFDLMELLWTFSICLESIAILPQLTALRKYRLVENLTGKFVFFLGMYRGFYILNWIYRSYTEPFYRHHYLVYACGVIQTVLYADFFYQYCQISCRCAPKGRSTRDEYIDDDDEDDTKLIFEVATSSPTNEKSSGIDKSTAASEPLLSNLGQDLEGRGEGESTFRSRPSPSTTPLE